MGSPRITGVVVRTAAVTIEHLAIPAGLRLRGHEHPHSHLCVLLAGGFAERDLGRTRSVLPGMLRRSPAGDRHDIHFRAPSRCLLVVLHGDPGGLSARLPTDRKFLQSGRIERLAGQLVTEIGEAEHASALHLDALALELLAASMPPLGRRASLPPAWLHRIRDRIRDAPEDPLPTADIAGEEGYHPVYVARAFREYFGTGIGEYARLVRAEFAYRLLAHSEEPLARVAARAGYADQSHLTRAMRRLLDTTPAALRRRRGGAIHVSSVQDGAAHDP